MASGIALIMSPALEATIVAPTIMIGAILNMNQDESCVVSFENRSINSVKRLSGSVDFNATSFCFRRF